MLYYSEENEGVASLLILSIMSKSIHKKKLRMCKMIDMSMLGVNLPQHSNSLTELVQGLSVRYESSQSSQSTSYCPQMRSKY